MLISALALALAVQASPTAAPQRAFIVCLKKELVAGLDDKVEPDAFAAAFKSKCTAEEATYRAALIAADRKSGISAANAEQSATDELFYWRDKFTGDYRSYFEDHTRPGN